MNMFGFLRKKKQEKVVIPTSARPVSEADETIARALRSLDENLNEKKAARATARKILGMHPGLALAGIKR
jgi:hypothetical protein